MQVKGVIFYGLLISASNFSVIYGIIKYDL